MFSYVMKFGMKRLPKEIAPPEPIHRGRGTGATKSFKFDEYI